MGGDHPRQGDRSRIAPLLPHNPVASEWSALTVQYKGGLGEDLKRERDTLAAADAQRDDAALETVASHRVDETGRQHGAGRSDRMAMRNRASLDIDDILRQTELAHYNNGDRRKGFVDLIRSMSLSFHPARSSAVRTAGIGPRPNIPGSTAATP